VSRTENTGDVKKKTAEVPLPWGAKASEEQSRLRAERRKKKKILVKRKGVYGGNEARGLDRPATHRKKTGGVLGGKQEKGGD